MENTETVIIQCECGLFLQGTVKREDRPPPAIIADTVQFSVSSVMALCPQCGAVVATPIEIHGPANPTK